MFSRKSCYFFVRPKRKVLEICVFLPRALKAPQIRKAVPSSKAKVANLIHVRHRDEVEAPITDWLEEAYAFSEAALKTAPPKARRAVAKGTRAPLKKKKSVAARKNR
jgi:hypothetical protein